MFSLGTWSSRIYLPLGYYTSPPNFISNRCVSWEIDRVKVWKRCRLGFSCTPIHTVARAESTASIGAPPVFLPSLNSSIHTVKLRRGGRSVGASSALCSCSSTDSSGGFVDCDSARFQRGFPLVLLLPLTPIHTVRLFILTGSVGAACLCVPESFCLA